MPERHPLASAPPNAAMAREAIMRKTIAEGDMAGQPLRVTEGGKPVEGDRSAVECPIRDCDGVLRMAGQLDMTYRSYDAPEMRSDYWCPDCGTTITLKSA